MTNILAPGIGESPAQNFNDRIEMFFFVATCLGPHDRALDQPVKMDGRCLRIFVNEPRFQQSLLSVADAEMKKATLALLFEYKDVYLLHFVLKKCIFGTISQGGALREYYFVNRVRLKIGQKMQ